MSYKKKETNKTKNPQLLFILYVSINHNIHYLLLLSLFTWYLFHITHTHDLMNTFIPNHWFSFSSFLFFLNSYFIDFDFWSILTTVDNVVIRGWVTWPHAICWLRLAIHCRVSRASPCLFASTVTPVFSLLWLFLRLTSSQGKDIAFFKTKDLQVLVNQLIMADVKKDVPVENNKVFSLCILFLFAA